MNSSSNKGKNQVKVFMSLFDIFAPKQFQDVYHLYSQEDKKHQTVSKAPCDKKDSNNLKRDINLVLKETPYITSERFHALNNRSSNKSIVRSTSTLFYDLDKLIKRHSYHCISQLKFLNNTVNISDKSNKNYFGRRSETIVQKCAAQFQPKLQLQDHFPVKKVKKNRLKHPKLSSEICLNDDNDEYYNSNLKHKDHRQKFWSYAKYETEYTNSIPKEKKRKKKDRGKRIEDPCPCQLFSYACPCTDTKSLTKLAKNSKCLTVADQITSTSKFIPDEVKENRYSKSKNSKCDQNHANKLMNTDDSEIPKKYEMSPVSEEAVAQIINARIIPKPTEASSITNNDTKIKRKSQKKIKQFFCPKCKEKIEILNTTEEEVSYEKLKNAPIDHTVYNENLFSKEDNDVCNHNPPCELVPICQILPNDTYFSSKHVENVSTVNHNPKMIRITKACRHHPPCTVVPSCQRVNVLKNNCEFIPPCLHQPRCINLPLCVPFSKKIYYDEISNKQTEEVDIADYPQYKYMSAYQQDSINSTADHQFHSTQNTCEYFSEYSPRLILNPKMTSISPVFSPYMPTPMPCKCFMANKSCQYDCIDCKCVPQNDIKEKSSEDPIVYIRDVGCQFRNKSLSPQDSLLYSKTSSTSFNFNSIKKTGKCLSEFYTLRCEDKYTNPISGEEMSMSTFTTSSLEIDVHCPSHGRHTNRGNTNFSPKPTASPFVAAFTTYTGQLLPNYLSIPEEIRQESKKCEKINNNLHITARPTKFRRSFFKGKRKKVFATKRQKKNKLESKSRSDWQSSS
ncbi:unnamed protein product [Euphydryas editha]|uniref:Uncharacterized protein n=1 Tax=Euphydryas editha TaxID=104508 RepID=A0AAU9TTN8_EUPED|nr:unnamed protein product [Euphydryas editha]